jgi:hypothetical protein
VLYNMLLSARNDVAPYYRHVVVACRDRAPVLPEPVTPADAAVTADTVQLALVGACLDLSLRHIAWQETKALYLHQQEIAEHLMARFSGIEAALAGLQESAGATDERLRSIDSLLRHPVRAVGRKVRRRDGGES